MCVCVCLCAVPVNFPRGRFHYYLKSGLGMAIGWSASSALGTILNVLVLAFNCIFDKQLLISTSSYLLLCFWQIPILAQRGSYCSGGDRMTIANQLCMRWVMTAARRRRRKRSSWHQAQGHLPYHVYCCYAA